MASEEFLQLANALPEAMLLVSGEGLVLAANRAAGERLGCRPADLPGRRLDSLTEGEAEPVRRYLVACSRSREMVPGLLRLRRADGEPLACRCEGAVVQPRCDPEPALVVLRFVPKQEAPNQFVVLNQRIQELTREISRRKLVEAQLREQREWLRVTLTSIGDAVIATDQRGQVIFVNPVAEALTGWSQAEACGRHLDEVFRIVHEETRQPVESPVAKVLRDRSVVGLANHTVLLARNGREWPIDDSGAPIRGDDGTMLGVVLVFREVSRRREMEAALRRQSTHLLEADRRKNEFLAMLAHELRNPLAPILTAAYVLRERGAEDPALQRHREIIERQARHLSRLVDDLLEVSRITRGLVSIRRQVIDLREVVGHAADAIRSQINDRSQTLELHLPVEPLCVDGDRDRLAQVVANLLNNASKYTPPGGHLRVSAGQEDGQAVVCVRDDGVGIGPDLLPSVFDLFTQGDQSLARTGGGLGIGLSMVKMLVELHGGSVAAHSDGAGLGSEFVVRLPLAETEAHGLGSPAAPRASGAPCLRVLVVEDNVDAADTMAELLQLCGHETRLAHHGGVAVALALEFAPHVVLLDIGLPEIDGYEVARRLRAAGALGLGCRLVALTGYGQEEDRRRTREAGFDHHLTKPVDPSQLELLLRRIFDQKGGASDEEGV